MKRIGFNISVKDGLTLEEIIQVHKLAKLSDQSKSKSDKIFYSKKVLKVLTDVKNPTRFHLRYLNKAIKAMGMKAPKKSTGDPLKPLYDIVYYLSHALNQTPRQIMAGTKQDDLLRLVKEIRNNKIKNYINDIRVQHDPAEFSKELFKRLRETVTKKLTNKPMPKATSFAKSFQNAMFGNKNIRVTQNG